MERKNTWLSYNEEDKKNLEVLASDYKEYLTNGKTERECVKESVKLALRDHERGSEYSRRSH